MIKRILLISIVIVLIGEVSFAKWVTDSKYKFKINVPDSWSSNSYMDGSDKVYDFYSPDENIAIQLRTFEATAGVTTDLIAEIFEGSYLPEGSKQQSLDDHVSKNGIPGKLGIYSGNYNGNPITMSAFYTVQNGIGYVILVIVPTSMLEQKSPEIQSVTQSFIIDGFGPQNGKKVKSTKLKGISGKVGGSKKQKTPATVTPDIAGRYNFISRSDGLSKVNYHYIDINRNGTYSEKYNPKNSGNYVGGTEGTWKVNGNKLILTHQHGGISDTYEINGSELVRTSGNGVKFKFRKQ